jgi:hypothetical protein
LARVVYYTLHEHPAYSPSFIRSYEANAHVTPLVSVIFVNQGESNQLSVRIRHCVVSVTDLVSLPEPVSVYGFTHESTGILPQAFIQKPVRA